VLALQQPQPQSLAGNGKHPLLQLDIFQKLLTLLEERKENRNQVKSKTNLLHLRPIKIGKAKQNLCNMLFPLIV